MIFAQLCSLFYLGALFKKIFFADLIKNIRDPEKPMTLEDLQVVYEDGVKVSNAFWILKGIS